MTKRRDLVGELESAGYRLCGGTRHEKYKKGSIVVMVPRHREIPDQMANVIRKQAGLK